MAKSSSSPQSLGDVLDDLIDRLGIQAQIDKASVIEAWAVVAGPQINGVTKAAWVKGRTLYVKIRSAAWRQELHMQRQRWCRRLNEHLEEELVEEVIFC